MKTADCIVLLWFAAASALAFTTFGLDKWKAARSRQRVPESFLAMLGALGGWPGGLLGMIVFHHKTAKGTFLLRYALALVPFAAEVWVWRRWR